ncbi:hypothetical protein B0G80_8757 [Paraburkholderia sp. BL6669N2]|nr:hypothetical protein B0G80_8757 [Paraburkholderia sp. BL6669N2]
MKGLCPFHLGQIRTFGAVVQSCDNPRLKQGRDGSFGAIVTLSPHLEQFLMKVLVSQPVGN